MYSAVGRPTIGLVRTGPPRIWPQFGSDSVVEGPVVAFVANVSGRPVPLGVCNPEEVMHHDRATQQDAKRDTKIEPRTSDNPQWPFRPTENGRSYLPEIAWLDLRTCGVIHPLYMLDGTRPTVFSTSFRIIAAVHGSESERTMFSEQHTTRNDPYPILLLDLDPSE